MNVATGLMAMEMLKYCYSANETVEVIHVDRLLNVGYSKPPRDQKEKKRAESVVAGI